VFCWCGGSLAPNEDIVRLRCGAGEAILAAFEKNYFCWFWVVLYYLTGLDLLYLDYCLLYKYDKHDRSLSQVCQCIP